MTEPPEHLERIIPWMNAQGLAAHAPIQTSARSVKGRRTS
jgi:hypothetical protein